MGVSSAGRPSDVLAPLEYMEEFIMDNDPLKANPVVKPSIVPLPFEDILLLRETL